MRHSPRMRLRPYAIAVGVVVILSACDDKRIRELDVGISKDSVIKVIGQGAPAGDSIPNIYRHNGYFVDGKMFDVYLFDAQNRKAWLDPMVTDKELTPVVVVDGKLEGTGWGYMDEVSKKYGIVIRAGSK